jgi:hypothetical protein
MKNRVIMLVVLFAFPYFLNAEQTAKIDTTGLVAWYPFNGNANDSSGHGHNGTIYGATLTADRFGNANSAYIFNGINNYIEVPYNLELNPTNAITISAWIKAYNLGWDSYSNYIVSTEQNSPNNGYSLRGGAKSVTIMISGGGSWYTAQSTYGTVDTGAWYHLVGVYNGSGLLLYLDGSLSASTSYGGGITASTGPLLIGTSPGSFLRWFNGIIDDIRLFNRALSDSEIVALYNETQDTLASGPQLVFPISDTIISTDTITYFWNALDSATGYRIQSCSDTTFISCELNEIVADTFIADTSVANGVHYWRVRGYISGGDSTQWSYTGCFRTDNFVVIDSTLIAYYPFNGNANDESGNGHHGIITGAILTNDRYGNYGNAYKFDGSDDYIDIGSLGDIENYSISMWTKKGIASGYPATFGGEADLFGVQSADNSKYFKIGFHNYHKDKVHFSIATSDSDCKSVYGNTAISDTLWHFVVATRQDSILKIFIDNIQDSLVTFYCVGNPVGPINYASTVCLGTVGGVNDLNFNGSLDDIKVWNKVLTEYEIDSIYSGVAYARPSEPFSGYHLSAAHPNPASGRVNISFSLPHAEFIRLEVFNILGQKVRTLLDGWQQAGKHEICWNIRTDSGEKVCKGIYFYSVNSSNFKSIRKLIVVD